MSDLIRIRFRSAADGYVADVHEVVGPDDFSALTREELEEQLEELEDALAELEANEPDEFHDEEYADWEDSRAELEMLIADVEDALDALDP